MESNRQGRFLGMSSELTRRTNFVMAIAIILILFYVGTLLVSNYYSQTGFVDAVRNRFVTVFEKQAMAMGYFFSERQQDLAALSKAREISNYFENKALGMSLKYGLGASLTDMQRSFDVLSDSRKIGGVRIYSWIAFVQPDGVPITTVSPEEEKIIYRRFQQNMPVSMDCMDTMLEKRDNQTYVIITIPYFFKQRLKGYIMADVPLEMVFGHLLDTRYVDDLSRIYLFCPESKVLFMAEDPEVAKWIVKHLEQEKKKSGFLSLNGMDSDIKAQTLVFARILPTPFVLIHLSPQDKFLSEINPRDSLVVMFLLFLLVFGSIFSLIRSNVQKQILAGQFKASMKNACEFELQNEKLSMEICQRKKSEERVRLSEEKYRTLVENMPDIVFSIDENLMITTINIPKNQQYSFEAGDVVGYTFERFIHEKDRKRLLKLTGMDLKEKRKYRRGASFRIVSTTGENTWVDLNLHYHYRDGDKSFSGANGVLRNITDRKLLEDQLVRRERLAAAGQLAASIAHEINSPLAGISALLGLVRQKNLDDKSTLQEIDLIGGAFESIGSIVKKLLNLNRPGLGVLQRANLNTIIRDTVELSQAYLKKRGIAVRLNLCALVPDFDCNSRNLGQVFLNLINNTIEAIETDTMKTDTFETEAESRSDEVDISSCKNEIIITTEVLSDKIIVDYVDTGPGICRENLDNIFDPFFTGKKGLGMGVGLSICHDIITCHNGNIKALPRKNGAWFAIEFLL